MNEAHFSADYDFEELTVVIEGVTFYVSALVTIDMVSYPGEGATRDTPPSEPYVEVSNHRIKNITTDACPAIKCPPAWREQLSRQIVERLDDIVEWMHDQLDEQLADV